MGHGSGEANRSNVRKILNSNPDEFNFSTRYKVRDDLEIWIEAIGSVVRDEDGDLIISSKGVAVFRVALDEQGAGVATEIGVSDPAGLEIRRTGELLVVNRGTNDVVDLDAEGEGDGTPIGIAPTVLVSPRGFGIESEFGIEIDMGARGVT